MKKWLIFIFCGIFLVACNNEKIDPAENLQDSINGVPTSVTMESDDFLYAIEVNNRVFTSGEPIDITASLTYIGKEQQIEISHAASAFYFDTKELSRGLSIDYPMDQPLIMTTLKKGEPITKKYVVSGGYSDQDTEEYVNFLKEFLSGNFPKGEYIVRGYVQFTANGESQELGGAIGFEVKN